MLSAGRFQDDAQGDNGSAGVARGVSGVLSESETSYDLLRQAELNGERRFQVRDPTENRPYIDGRKVSDFPFHGMKDVSPIHFIRKNLAEFGIGLIGGDGRRS